MDVGKENSGPRAPSLTPQHSSNSNASCRSSARPASGHHSAIVEDVQRHMLRLHVARAMKEQTMAAAAARAAAERRAIVARVDARAKAAARQRSAQIAAVYGKGGRGGGGGNSQTLAPPPPPQVGLVIQHDEILGEGATGKVYAATFGPRRTPVAAKLVRKQGMRDDEIGWIRDEIAIHKRLNHPHICKMHAAIENESSFVMVMQVCTGGTLCDTMGRALETNQPLTEATAHSAFVQLCAALLYCHRLGVVHRDIKLDNLCWTSPDETTLQLIDFGYAGTSEFAHNFAGSPHYAAPEVHLADVGGPEFSAVQSDVWSAGVCLFAMLATALPFGGGEDTAEEREQLRRKVCAGEWDVEPQGCSAAAIDLVSRLLLVDADERIRLDEACDHAWVGGLETVPWQGDLEVEEGDR